MVTAHVSASGVLSAHIATPSETYHIEPSRHLVSKPHPFHMVAYKASHVKNRLGSHRVDFVSPSREIPLQENNQGMDQSGFSHSDSTFEKSSLHSETSASGSKHGNRLKRQTAAANFPGDLSGDSCPMVLVSDFTVFSEVGSEDSIINRLVSWSCDLIMMSYYIITKSFHCLRCCWCVQLTSPYSVPRSGSLTSIDLGYPDWDWTYAQ